MPLPDESTLGWIGNEIERVGKHDHRTVEHIVSRALKLPARLLEKLCEVAVWESEVWIADFPDHMIHSLNRESRGSPPFFD